MVFDAYRDTRPSGLYKPGAHRSKGLGGFDVGAPGSGYLADLVRVPIDYLLELWIEAVDDDGKDASWLDSAITLPLAPEMLDIARPGATELAHTAGNKPIKEHSRHRHLTISISGRSGVQARAGYNRDGEVVFYPGPRILREADAFLDRYQSTALVFERSAASNPDSDGGVRGAYLVFRALREKIHVKVDVEQWRRTRNKDNSRLGESTLWRLELEAYAPAVPVEPTGPLGPIADGAEALAEFVNAGNAAVSLADNAVTNLRTDIARLRAPAQALANTGRLLSSIGAGARGAISDVAGTVAAYATAWESLSEGLRDVLGLDGLVPDASAQAASPAEDLLAAGDESGIGAFTVLGFAGADPAFISTSRAIAAADGPEAVARLVPARSLGAERLIEVTLQAGQSLERLASQLLGDSTRWVEIADLNGLIDSETLGDGSPLRAGVRLQIPTTDTAPALIDPSDPEAFGVDLYIDPTTGDLEVSGDALDVRRVQGPPLLEQALRHRLVTQQGQSVFDAYGLPIAPGDRLTASTAGYAAAHFREQLTRDPRLSDIDDVLVDDGGDALAVRVDVVAVTGQRIPVAAPVPREG